MIYEDEKLFNTREYCREQVFTYLNYYSKDNNPEIDIGLINSIAQYVGRVSRDIHGLKFFCDEIDVEILFNSYIKYKNLDTSQDSERQINMLKGYMARILQKKINEFYKSLKKGEYGAELKNLGSKKNKKNFIEKCEKLRKQNPKNIRKP